MRTPSGRPPGALALWIAIGLGVVSFLLFAFSQVPVDDRDEPLPQNGLRFQALHFAARSILTGEQVRARDVSVFDAHGPGVIIYGLVPLVILAAVFIAFRRSPSSRPLTIGMLAMAVVILFAGGAFLYSVVALAVASFQARRAEIPARMAQRAAAQQEAEGDDAEDEEYDEEDEYLDEDEYDEEDEYLDEDEEYDEEEGDVEDEDVEDEDVDVDEEDEAVLADEADETGDEGVTDAEAGEGEDEAVDQAPTRGRRKR